MACGPPRRGLPVALGPNRSLLARYERTCDSDDSERAGGEKTAARATTSEAKPCPANRPSGQTATTTKHAADVKASSTGAKVLPGGGEGTCRYAIKAWS